MNQAPTTPRPDGGPLWDGIPSPLQARLDALRGVLEIQGVVQLQTGLERLPAYRLRYREADAEGTIVHRSLPLGADAKVAEAVRAQIALWRAERATEAAEQRAKAEGEKRRRKEESLCAQLAQNIVGGGRRRQQQIREWYAEMTTEPHAMMKFALTGAFPEPRKPGRPRKVRLW